MPRRTALLLALSAGLLAVTPSLLPPATAGDAPAKTTTAQKSELTPSKMTEADWEAVLTDHEYYVLRKKGTERAFSGEFWDHHDQGTYVCGGCGDPLFASDHKFESGTGWPSFYKAVEEGRVTTMTDGMLGMRRVEILCANCGGHLGHVFPDGPKPTGERYCVNSASLDFVATQATLPSVK
jgi:peptide-methionine (R)-S-oxide reductase